MNPEIVAIRGLIAVAVGVGVLLGVAGTFLYQQFLPEERRMLHQREFAPQHRTVAEMRNQPDAQGKKSGRRSVFQKAKRKSLSTTETEVVTGIDQQSAVETNDDDDDDEFFDCSDENNVETETDPRLAKLLDKVDILFKGTVECNKTAYSLLLQLKDQYADKVNVLWRLAKASHIMGTVYGEEGDNDKKKEFLFEGFGFAKRALELDESHPEAHKWFAITVGARGEFLSLPEKIEGGSLFKEHVDKALALQPYDPSLHHLLGRFKYEVANLSWIERKVAGVICAEPPTATYPEAVNHCLEAEYLSPTPWKENRLLLAKCHFNQGNYTDAFRWLKCALLVPVVTLDDRSADREARSLLPDYERYLK
ncbi:hypothetical protein B7P43_G10678 [Cryptotermes secundus]|uniref:Regulator of microtubule dynamics protein 2 n=1 Tax=Cryptotermes secundus TaxID=105785 RepID=A0A2J7R5T0_9NEOP|nr:regulator of microtubule dynamics protein 1 isoform X1 [Cryptotermes secundus]XP_033606853.1 regulator of microtubule dynamics protein 1 isoform X1 [Cryptotermes secundus]PNF36188.1 hypothetical protein B7P43_G10678 [Cryptotermes secundus]PNF36190.1 hypothetical protein B7P43_G10678 [Cryptotermes secundus]